MYRVRSLLSMRCLLLGYRFNSRPNSRARGIVLTIGLLINRCSHAKNEFDERTSRVPNAWAGLFKAEVRLYRVSAKFELTYERLKSKFSLILFVNKLMIGCS